MTDDQHLDLVEQLADEFARRLRAGERPSIKEYTDRHPELAEIIRDTFEALAMMENMAPGSDVSASGSLDDGAAASLPGLKQLGDFRILREVGRGGMGIVYEAEQLSLGRRVALKVLPQQMLLDKKHKRRFEREAKAAAKLHHTNIVPVFGVGDQDGLHYYVMQFIQGLGLDEVIGELQRMRETSQAGRGSSQAELRISLRAGDVSAGKVARSLMTGEFERTILTNADAEGEEGAIRLGCTAGDDPQGTRPSVTAPQTQLEVQQSGAGPVDFALSSSGLKDAPSARLADSLALSGSFSLPRQGDGSVSTSTSRARRKQTFWTSVAHIGQQVASALQYAHEQGITHRDIKPSNLLLDMRGTVWVTDFGLAKASDQQDITHTGDILGTLRYMPPEAFEGVSDARSDLYSLGLTLYELLAQRPAFEERDRHKLIKLVTTTEPPRLEKLNRDVPRDLATIVHKTIDRDPAHRYQSARELADDLQRFLEDEPIKARRVSVTERLTRWSRRNKGLAASLAVVCLLLLVINIAGPVMTWQIKVAERDAAKEAARNKQLAGEQTALAEKMKVLADQEKTARRESQSMLADLQTERGFLAARDNDPAEAALWFATAAGETPHDPHRQAMNGLRARNWLNRAYQPVAFMVLPRGGRPRKVEFQPNGRILLTLHTTGAEVWDWWAEEPLAWSRDLANVADACWSPDGRRMALAFTSGETQVRDSVTGNIELSLAHPTGANAIAWSPDGHRLAIAGSKQVDLWDVRAEPKLALSWPHPAAVHAIVFNTSGDRLATACDDKQVRVYAVSGDQTGTQPLFAPLPHDFQGSGQEGPVFRPPVFIDNDRAIVTARPDRRVGWWSTASGEDVTPGPTETGGGFARRLFRSREGNWFGVTGFAGAYGFDVRHTDGRAFPRPHTNQVLDVKFFPDDAALVTTSANGTTRIWTLPPGHDPLWTIRQMEAVVLTAVSGDGALALCGSNSLCVWRQSLVDASVGEVEQWSAPHRRPRPGFDGRLATLGIWHESPDHGPTASDTLSVLHVESVQPAGPTIALPGRLWDSCLCADNRTVAVACVDGEVGILGFYNVATGAAGTAVVRLSGPPQSIAARPGHPHVAVLCRDGTLQVVDHRDGTLLRSFDGGESSQIRQRVTWSPDGSALVTLYDPRQVVVRDADTGKPRFRSIQAGEQCHFRTLAVSPDGRWLATAVNGRRNDVQVWDLATGKPAGPPLPHPGAGDVWGVFAVAFSPDGRFVLTGDKDGRARLWDWKSGELQCPPMSHADEVYDVAFTEDGRFALTAVRFETVHVWDLVSGKRVAPPLSLATPGAETLAVVGDRVIVGAPGYPVFSLSSLLQGPDVPGDALLTNAELACGRTMQLGELTPLAHAAWAERWASSHAVGPAYPALVERLAHQIDAATDAGTRRNIARQALHLGVLDRLAELRPQALPLQFVLFRELLRTGDAYANSKLEIVTARLMEAPLPDDPLSAFELASLIFEAQHIAGLRESATIDRPGPDRAQWRFAEQEKLGDPWLKLGAAYVLAGHSRRAAESFVRALERAPEFAAGLDRAQRTERLESRLRDLIAQRMEDAALLRTLAEVLLAESPAHESLARFLADLLLAETDDWTLVEPSDMRSTDGTTLTARADGSILASRDPRTNDTYRITGRSGARSIAAFRLEALPDPRVEGAGPGWGGGNFHLTGFRALWQRPGGEYVSLPVRTAAASHVRTVAEGAGPNDGPQAAIDGNRQTKWDIWPRPGQPHSLTLVLAEPVDLNEGDRIVVELDFLDSRYPLAKLGCFRLSVTDDAEALETARQRSIVQEIGDPWVRLGAAYAAAGDAEQAAGWFTSALARTPGFTARRELVQRIDALQTDLSELIAMHPDEPLLWDSLTRRQVADGNHEAAAQSLARARSLTEALLETSPGDEALAGFLADLLLDDTTVWTVLEPIAMNGGEGETFTLQEDGSIFVSGVNPERAIYTLTLPLNGRPVSAIRLETLPDARLPHGGAGRYPDNGNFHLSEFTAAVASGDNAAEWKLIPIANAVDDYHAALDVSVSWAIDGEPHTRWDTSPQEQTPHWAVFAFQSQVPATEGHLIATLDSGTSPWTGTGLGSFRLSVTDDPAAFHRVAASRIANPWIRLAAAYWLVGEHDAMNQALAQTALTGPADMPPFEGPRFSRRSGEKETAITFVNHTGGPVELIWLNDAGEPQNRGTIAAGAENRQQTYVGDVFLIVDERGGELGLFAGQEQARVVEITRAGPAAVPTYHGPRFSRRSGERKTVITFVNNTAGPVELIWLSADGEPKSYAKIAPGAELRQGTYVGDVWLVADERGGELGLFAGQEQERVVPITGPGAIVDGPYAPAGGNAQDRAVLWDLIEEIDRLPMDFGGLMALRPDDPVIEWVRWRRRFRESTSAASDAQLVAEFFAFLKQTTDATGDDQLIVEFFEFLEQTTDINLRSLLNDRELRDVLDGDRFERLLEQHLARSTSVVRQQVWAKQAHEPGWEHRSAERTDHERLIRQYASEGRRPTFLSTSQHPNGPHFVTIWTRDGRDHRIETSLTRQQFDALLKTPPDGMQLISVEECLDGPETRYAALWVKQASPAPWELHERLSASETAQLADTMQARKFRPTYVNAYPDGTLTTVWIRDDGQSELLLGLTYHDLQDLEQERADDCLPIGLDSHFDGRRRRYSVIIDNGITDVQWKFSLLDRSSEVQALFDEYVQSGWKPLVTTESPVGRADQ